MKADKSNLSLFIDEELQPNEEFTVSKQLDLDCQELKDREHTFNLENNTSTVKEGVRKIKFILEESDTPQSVPSWLWIILIAFFSWAAFYIVTNFSL